MNTNLSQELLLRRQLYLDGLRYAINMASFSYSRLEKLLVSVSDIRKPNQDEFISAFLDAWLIVDSIFRYRTIVISTPGIKQNDPQIKNFLEKTKMLKASRNYMQHSNSWNHFEELKNNSRPFWGILSWVRTYSEKSARLCSIFAGSLPYTNSQIPSVNPLGKTVKVPIDLVFLYVASYQICLSDIIKDTVENYRNILKQNGTGSISDVFISVDLTT
ncbi:MAG: hypothetical protein V1704_02570 [Candidatus Vogelbacteria bacterium]